MMHWSWNCLTAALYVVGLLGFGLAFLFMLGLISLYWSYW